MKKPFVYALSAATYIVLIVNIIQSTSNFKKETIFIPITMLGLFVLSVAIMGFLFFYEPFILYMENRKKEAAVFFGKTLGFFACFVLISSLLILFKN